MEYIVIIVSIIAIILVLLARFYNLSIIYPTLVIILAIILDILVNVVRNRKKTNNVNNPKDINGKK